MALNFKLNAIREEIGLSKNAIAVEGRLRPATIAKYDKGEVERIETETLDGILNAVNRLAIKEEEKGKGYKARVYKIEDLIEYTFDEGASE
ncbi:XRE family transcriptional regulator [Rossellomorea marisflavi]|uniref:XRE family transcriptional regulator n=1 Tax=Rossellomorea marisflavi TaxID=189381 RepID=A0A5D4S5I7_9BACI|nr:XRE family transcriptional regulator [Rossellomorea marisflavi]TYS57002.1 XRE family transcriptional regulator [Rossellomorea marisflavi]